MSNTKLIDRNNPRTAAAVFKMLFPSTSLRQCCVAEMANSVAKANEIDPSGWSITLFDQSVRMNVGGQEVLYYYPGFIRCIIDPRCIPSVLRDPQNSDLTVSSFRRSPGVGYDIPIDRVEELLPLLRASHESLLAEATKPTALRFRRTYSPGVVDYLTATTGQTLSHPSYYVQKQTASPTRKNVTQKPK